jgi:phage internal scaffolding protein
MTNSTKLRKRSQLYFEKPSRTKQAFKDECDINRIMQKYEKTRLLTHTQKTQGQYGDFSDVSDYQTSVNAVLGAEQAFLDLPSALRKRFNNDPSEFINFTLDEKNYSEAAKLGLLTPEKTQAYLQSLTPTPTPQNPQTTQEPPKNDV